ncbi:hypothetical protein N665_0055s0025, partial [Sinapis alba]
LTRGKSSKLRWKNYLRPNIKRGDMSPEEQDLIIRMHKLIRNWYFLVSPFIPKQLVNYFYISTRWSLIAGRLPGRKDNEVKNYWYTHLNKKSNCKKQKATESPVISPEVRRSHGEEDGTTTTCMEETNCFGYDVPIGSPVPLISPYPDTLVFDPCFVFTDFFPLL